MMSPLRVFRVLFLCLAISLSACGGGGGGAAPTNTPVSPPPPPSSISGVAKNSVIVGAEIKLFRFDAGGMELEIAASNAPVTTKARGEFYFAVPNGGIGADAGPLIIRSVGGVMNSAAAPTLEALIADSSALQVDRNQTTQNLSPATSVAAALLRLQAASSAAAPTVGAANAVIAQVENALGFSLEQDPEDPTTALALFSRSIDNNLGLTESPDNNPAVEEFIEYMALNLSSESGVLDNTMLDPATGDTVAAGFAGIGSGLLDAIVTAGPSSIQLAHFAIDKTELENDGMDTAFLEIFLSSATGEPASDGTMVSLETSAGRLTISKYLPFTVGGSARVNVSSVWAGDAEITVITGIANGGVASFPVALDIVDNVADVDDDNLPRISGAGATGNNEIIVTFNEAMRGGIESAENPAHYRISGVKSLISSPVTKSIEPEIANPEVLIIDAELILPERNAVRLTTWSQSDLRYELVVVNTVDLQGNAMAPGDQFQNAPNRMEFQGVPPSGDEVVDTDGDGLSDSDEQRGWIVTTITAAGQVLRFEVTSDPNNADTDGDGVSDYEEFHGGLNPRTADSDGDTLSDDLEWNTVFSDGLNQDSDGDGVQDGFEYYTFRTSPILADTDGDQFSDPDEVSAGNRNPLVADLPSPVITIGEIQLELDTRFTFTDVTGQSDTTTDSVSTNLVRKQDDKLSTSRENSYKSSVGFSQELEVGFGQDGTLGWSGKATFGSTQSTERGNTLTTSSESATGSEEAYNSSLQTAVTRDLSKSVTREIVGASAQVDLSISNAGTIPFTIDSLEITLQSQDPQDRRRIVPIASLVPANNFGGFGDTEGLEVNVGVLGATERGPFVFSSSEGEAVFPARVEQLLKNPQGVIASLANYNIRDEFGRNFTFISNDVVNRTAGLTFDFGDGTSESYRIATASAHDRSTGRPLGITMEYALSIIGLQRYPTIRDGGNGIVETQASGDDEQKVEYGAAIEPREIIILAISDALNSTPDPEGDDEIVMADYETTSFLVDGELGPKYLTRFRSVGIREDNPSTPNLREDKQFWAVLSSKELAGTDFDDIVVRAGDTFDISFVKDEDNDGVWAREESLHRSSDTDEDTDDDSLSDAEEIQEGWRIQVRGSSLIERVYPDPTQVDSDADGLTDLLERSCGLDPRKRDTDLDGLSDADELLGTGLLSGSPRYINDGGGSALVAHEPLRAIDIDAGLLFGICDPDGLMTGAFATDPLNPDTDGDTIPDGAEIALGIDPNLFADGAGFIDSDQDGLVDSVETDGFSARLNTAGNVRFTSDPFDADSDDDGLPDLLEHYLGSNPQSEDTDGDGLLDRLEYAGAETCITLDTMAPNTCIDFQLRRYDEYVADCTDAPACNVVVALATSYDSNLNESDTDKDLLPDSEEITGSWLIARTIRGLTDSYSVGACDTCIRKTEIRNFDTDGDSIPDGQETNSLRGYLTDPTSADSDGDGRDDDIDWPSSNPLVPEIKLQITVNEVRVLTGIGEDIDPRVFVCTPAQVAFGGVVFEMCGTEFAAWSGSNVADNTAISDGDEILIFGGLPYLLLTDVTSTDNIEIRFIAYDNEGGSTNDLLNLADRTFDYDSATIGDGSEETITLNNSSEGSVSIRYQISALDQ